MFIFANPRDYKTIAAAMFRSSEFINFTVHMAIRENIETSWLNCHYTELRVPQGVGLTRKLWEDWFYAVVQSQHIGFTFRNFQNEDDFANWKLSQFNHSPFIENGRQMSDIFEVDEDISDFSENFGGLQMIIKKTTDSQIAQIPEKVKNVLGNPSDNNVTPVDLWPGAEEVKSALNRSWITYKLDYENRVHHLSDFERILQHEDSVVSDISNILKAALAGKKKVVQIYLVNYWYPFYHVVGSSIVIGLRYATPTEPFSVENLKSMLTEALPEVQV